MGGGPEPGRDRFSEKLAGSLWATVSRSTHSLRCFWRTIHQPLLVFVFFLNEKIAQRVDVVTELLAQFSPDRTYFGNNRIFKGRFHGASSSSGVQTIGGS